VSDTNYSNGELLGLAGKAVARLHGVPTAGVSQKVNFTATAATSGLLPSDISVILTATQPCFVRFSPDASSVVVDVDMYLAANMPYLLRLGINNRYISVVRSTTDGVLYITPMSAE
jgi:hypothetical protein